MHPVAFLDRSDNQFGYDNLIHISDDLREKLKGLCLSLIRVELEIHTLNISRDDRRLLLDSRKILFDQIADKLIDHLKLYDKYQRSYWSAVEASSTLLAPCFDGIFSATFRGTEIVGRHGGMSVSEEQQAATKLYDHENQTISKLADELASYIREKVQRFDKEERSFEEWLQREERNVRDLVQAN